MNIQFTIRIYTYIHVCNCASLWFWHWINLRPSDFSSRSKLRFWARYSNLKILHHKWWPKESNSPQGRAPQFLWAYSLSKWCCAEARGLSLLCLLIQLRYVCCEIDIPIVSLDQSTSHYDQSPAWNPPEAPEKTEADLFSWAVSADPTAGPIFVSWNLSKSHKVIDSPWLEYVYKSYTIFEYETIFEAKCRIRLTNPQCQHYILNLDI